MIRKEKGDISDLEYEKTVQKCDIDLINYIKNEFLNEFLAFYIATLYVKNALWDDALDLHIGSALDYLSTISLNDCNKNKIKNILKDKYKLKILKESPLEIVEV